MTGQRRWRLGVWLLLAACLAAQAAPDIRGEWRLGPGVVVDVRPTESGFKGTYQRLWPGLDNPRDIAIGDPAFEGAWDGEVFRGTLFARFPARLTRRCDPQPVAEAKLTLALEAGAHCARLTGVYVDSSVGDDRGCTVATRPARNPLQLRFLGPRVDARACPRFLLGIVSADFTTHANDFSDRCARSTTVPALMRGRFDPARPGAAPGDTTYNRLEDFLRSRAAVLGHSPVKGNACYRRVREDALEDDYPICREPELLTALTAEYYWSKKRLLDGVRASFEQLAAFDKLRAMDCSAAAAAAGRLGISTRADLMHGGREEGEPGDTRAVDCGDYRDFPELQRACRRLHGQCTEAVDYRDTLPTDWGPITAAEALPRLPARLASTAERPPAGER